MNPKLARRMTRLKASAIREILKVTERPDILSFAGGLPAPEAFPIEALARAHAEVLASDGAGALQYGPTEGHGPLRAWVAARMATRHYQVAPEQVLITAGSQQGIDLVAKALLDPGDLVVDPFNGSGTTGVVAVARGRRYAGLDLDPVYLDLTARRLAGVARDAPV